MPTNSLANDPRANYFLASNAQANSPTAGIMRDPNSLLPSWLKSLPTITPYSSGAPYSGGLFPQMNPMPSLGGLMDFNALALQLAGNPGTTPMSSQMNNNLFAGATDPRLLISNPLINPIIRNPRANIGVRG